VGNNVSFPKVCKRMKHLFEGQKSIHRGHYGSADGWLRAMLHAESPRLAALVAETLDDREMNGAAGAYLPWLRT
jgi:hypothetical protein